MNNTICTDTTAEMVEVVSRLVDAGLTFRVYRNHEGVPFGNGTPWRIEILTP
jgi:hypothetical protein